MVTIRQIAEQLGVSPTTVSNVLNGNTTRMSPDTKQKIEEALQKNHYFRTPKSNLSTVPLVVVAFDQWKKENMVIDPFFGEVLGSVEVELRRYGRSVVFSVQENEEQLKKLLTGYNVEGAILTAYQPQLSEKLHKSSAKPLVFIDSGQGDFYNIGLQDMEGAREITAYLLKLGHKRIAFFSDQQYPALTSNANRLEGFRQALEQYGMAFLREDYIYLPPEIHTRHEVLRQFAKQKAKKIYTAAFFVSDLLANEAVHIFAAQDILIPEELSITGFDDNIYARQCRPMLTTIRQSPSDKGKEAVRMLMKRIQGEEIYLNYLELPTELIVRESVKNIAK